MKQSKGILIFNQACLDLSLISALLEAEECTVFVTSLPLEAIHILKNNDIDVILASPHLEGMEGREFKELAEKIRPGVSIFLLPMVCGEKGTLPEQKYDCTVNLKEFAQFIQNHIRTENRLITESSRFKEFFFAFTDRLLQVFEVNDKYFFNNDHLVADLSQKVASKMGLEEKLVDAIHLAALLRDIGKIGIQHEILDEKGRLEKDEFTLIKSHPLNTVQILKQINFPWNVESIISHHHEHYDGKGYPDALKGRNIPLGSRIISIADSYVAMTMDRPYRKALSREDATREILKKAGSQFDPEVVEVFLSVLQQEKFQATEKKRIMVLDRDEAVAAFIKLNLSGEEFEVIQAATAIEALKQMKDNNPYLIVADSDTLSIDRFHFYNVIRQNSATDTIPFIIIVPDEEFPQQLTDPMVDFIVKPLNMDELSSKIKTLSTKNHPEPKMRPPGEEMKGVAGSLEDMGITDIIQVMNMGLKTAKVILIKDRDKGEIYLRDGKIVNVQLGNLSGHDAFFELIGWDKGVFRIFHGHTTEETNITMDTMTLLLEATKALDEKRYKGK